MESDTGYRISKVKTAAICEYYAWGRAVSRESLQSRQRAHYAIGEHVPQSRVLIGVYPTALTAKQACRQHAGSIAA